MGVATALAIGGAAVAAGGAIRAGQAGKDAASAQGAIAQQQLAAAQKAASFAAPTSDELNTLSNQVKLYDNAYANSQAQLSTLNKQITDTYGANIVEQGKQLHDAQMGADSVITQQANDQVQRQRAAYAQQLTDKLGPGALTSSAGIQALANFDRQAQQGLAQTRETALNNLVSRLGGLQGSQSSAVQGVLGINNSLSGMLGSIQGTQNNFQTRQINAQNNITQYAGADQVQRLQDAKNTAASWNSISNLGATVAGAGLSGAFKQTTAPVAANAAPGLATNGFDSSTLAAGQANALDNFQFQPSGQSSANSNLDFSKMNWGNG